MFQQYIELIIVLSILKCRIALDAMARAKMMGKKILYDHWSFTEAERRAITRIAFVAASVENISGIGQATMDKLVAKRVAEEVDADRRGRPLYGLTDGGKQVFDGLAKTNRVVR